MNAKQKREAFLVDCIARSLSTLPYSTIDSEDYRKDGRGRDTIRKLQDVIRSPTEEGLAMLVDTLMSEISTHEMCGNGMKADYIETWLEGAESFCRDRMRVATLRQGLRQAVRS